MVQAFFRWSSFKLITVGREVLPRLIWTMWMDSIRPASEVVNATWKKRFWLPPTNTRIQELSSGYHILSDHAESVCV
jgi:hypothetical protein